MWSMKSLGPWIHKLVASVALAAVVTMMVALCSRTAAFSDYELWGYDFLVTHRSAERALSDVVIVDFDDAAFERLKQYPIPRNVVAEVISRVAASSPRVIGVDLFLSEPRTASEDTAMRMALGEAGNVVLASQSAAGGVPHLLPLRDFCDPETPSSDAGYCKEGSKSALGYAVVNLPVDSDGFVRSFFLFAGNPRNGVSFPVMLAQLARGESIKPGNEKTVIFLGRKISAFPDPGGGSRGIGGTTTLLAPRIGRTFTAHPTFRWSHSAQAQNFIFQLYDDSGTSLYKARVDGREYRYPETAPELRPGTMYRWNVRPEVGLLGGSSETFRFVRVTETEIKEIADGLQQIGVDSKEHQEQRAQILADHRLWFDAVDAYTDLITKNPEDPELHEKRGQIYDQLPGTRSLGEEDFAIAQQLRSKSSL
jgi:hypothetical protein